VQNSRPAPAARMRVVVYMSELNDASVSFCQLFTFLGKFRRNFLSAPINEK